LFDSKICLCEAPLGETAQAQNLARADRKTTPFSESSIVSLRRVSRPASSSVPVAPQTRDLVSCLSTIYYLAVSDSNPPRHFARIAISAFLEEVRGGSSLQVLVDSASPATSAARSLALSSPLASGPGHITNIRDRPGRLSGSGVVSALNCTMGESTGPCQTSDFSKPQTFPSALFPQRKSCHWRQSRPLFQPRFQLFRNFSKTLTKRRWCLS